jgi:hypothetical protein
MQNLNRQVLYFLFFSLHLVIPSVIQAEDPVRKKLENAKEQYEKDSEKLGKLINEWFDNTEVQVRKQGDKKLLESHQAARQAFEKKWLLPPSIPVAYQKRAFQLRSNIENAYQSAIKQCVRNGDDKLAEEVEKDFELFSTRFDLRQEWIGTQSSFVFQGHGVWKETLVAGKEYRWFELSRTDECIEVFDEERKFYGFLYSDKLLAGTTREKLFVAGAGQWKRQ